MQQTILLGDGFSPPALPPAFPAIPFPPPPPSPPWPAVPTSEEGRLVFVDAPHVTLSTYFLPAAIDAVAEAALSAEAVAADAYSENAGNHAKLVARSAVRGEILDALNTRPGDAWAACSLWLEAARGAPLPCRTGDLAARCLDGARRCAQDPMADPWLELDVREPPADAVYGPLGELKPLTPGAYYLFAVWFELPSNDEYAALLFRSPDADNPTMDADEIGSGYELELRDDHHQVLDVQCEPLSKASRRLRRGSGASSTGAWRRRPSRLRTRRSRAWRTCASCCPAGCA